MEIVRPITDDGLVGFNKNHQLVHCTVDGEYKTFVGIADVRRDTCIICAHGWQATAASLGDQYFWDLTKTQVHRSCFIRREGLCERADAWRALVLAKVRFGGLIIVPNRYWPKWDPWSAKPWYEAELIDYPVKISIGARKHVYNIEFHAQGGTKLDWWEGAKEAFKNDDVTKEFSDGVVLLHAWGTDKMIEYVKRIVVLAGYDKEIEKK